MKPTDLVASLAALAHPLRLEVFRALAVSGTAGMTPGVMQEALQVPAATLSFHLKALAEAGLVTPDRSGRHLIYRPDCERVDVLAAYLAEHCGTRASIPAIAAERDA